jgi:hypothetical protein
LGIPGPTNVHALKKLCDVPIAPVRITMSAENSEHQVKRVQLPSGKTIEVVYFEQHGGTLAETRRDYTTDGLPRVDRPRELHVCESCKSELVYPTEWAEAGPEHWNVTLRCPECEWVGCGTFHQDIVDDLDERLDTGTDALVRDLKQLMSANMAEEVERFKHALDVDAILPEDF